MNVIATEQPVGRVYVISVSPVVIPLTSPLEEFISATEGTVLLQDPPAEALVSIVVDPAIV